jgi:hypothetical protein
MTGKPVVGVNAGDSSPVAGVLTNLQQAPTSSSTMLKHAGQPVPSLLAPGPDMPMANPEGN